MRHTPCWRAPPTRPTLPRWLRTTNHRQSCAGSCSHWCRTSKHQLLCIRKRDSATQAIRLQQGSWQPHQAEATSISLISQNANSAPQLWPPSTGRPSEKNHDIGDAPLAKYSRISHNRLIRCSGNSSNDHTNLKIRARHSGTGSYTREVSSQRST